jgi:hypothetical protein
MQEGLLALVRVYYDRLSCISISQVWGQVIFENAMETSRISRPSLSELFQRQ